MSVRLQLDQHNVPFYTNLDYISGRVYLSLPSDATISAITVKLEGESTTRLAGPRDSYDRREKVRTELERHKLLYKVQTVFPSPELAQHGSTNTQYTLAAGQYEYSFRFKVGIFPFNNDCSNTSNNVLRDLKFGQLNVQLGPDTTRHVKRTLPPSLSGFPGEAEIAYFVKATVVRPKFYQENLRAQTAIKFQPIEPPRPVSQSQETFARRQHQFQAYHELPKKSLFRKDLGSLQNDQLLSFRVDARLPSPAIITCHQPLPLRILVERLSESPADIYLSMLQIELIATTNIRAHDLNRTEMSSWILMSKANMNLLLRKPTDKGVNEYAVPPLLWDDLPLPNTVAPSFETCNISRQYELEVRVGISHGMAQGIRPELIVLPLRLAVQVFSGIAPSAQLLDRMATALSARKPTRKSSGGPHSNDPGIPPYSPHTPVGEYHSSAQLGTQGQPGVPAYGDVAPPSYEDAIADDIGPIDGPRPNFETSPGSTGQVQQPMYLGDSKSSSGLNRYPSERLFAQNAPRPPRSGSRRQKTDPSTHSSTVYECQSTPGSAKHSTDQQDGVSEIAQQMQNTTIESSMESPETAQPTAPKRKDTSTSIKTEKN